MTCPTSRKWPRRTVALAAAVAPAAVSLLAPHAARAADPTHRYSFNEAGGTVVTDTGTVGGANGTLVVRTATGAGAAAITGGAVNLANTGNSNNVTTGNYVDLPNQLFNPQADFTVEGWATWGGGGNWQRIFDFGTNSAGEIQPADTTTTGYNAANNSFVFVTPQSGGGTYYAEQKLAGVSDIAQAGPNFGAGVLRQFLLTKTGNTMSLYRDGVFVASETTATNSPAQADLVNVWLGRSNFQPDPFFNGSISEFRTYQVGLNGADVLRNAQAGPDVLVGALNTIAWNTPAGEFGTAGNWTPNTVPTALTDVGVIGNGGTANVTASTTSQAQVQITNGALAVSGAGVTFTVGGVDLAPGSAGTAAVTVSNGATLAAGGILADSNGTTTGTGAKTITIDNGTLRANGDLVASGTGFGTTVGPGGGTFDLNGRTIRLGNLTVNGRLTATSATAGGVLGATGDFVVGGPGATGSVVGGAANTTFAINPVAFRVGTTGTSSGAVLQTSGSVTGAGGGGDWQIGGSGGAAEPNAVGAYDLAGGTFQTGNNFQIGARGRGIMTVRGGTLTTTGGFPAVGRFGGSTGVLTVQSGAFNQNSGGTVLIVAEDGAGTLNVFGSGTVNLGNNTGGLRIGLAATGSGQVNLGAGGTIIAQSVSRGTGTAAFNFNGGTLRANAATATFLQGLTSAHVNAGVSTIDTQANNVTIAQDLLAPTGSGVATIPVTGGGTGYVATPMVQLTGGGGTGAAAVANLNAAGVVTGITITNPGVGYTSAPTVTLVGGNPTTPAALGAATTAANVSGGIRKTGTGTLTLSGNNTFGGPLEVQAGTVTLASAGAFPAGAALIVNGGSAGATQFSGGTLDLGGNSPTAGALSGGGGTAGGVITNNGPAPATLTVGGGNASSEFGGSVRDGSAAVSLNKTGSGTLTLTGAHTYSGTTTVSGGTLRLGTTPTANTRWTADSLTGASGTPVTTWTDNVSGRSANTLNATAPTLQTGVLNGRNVVRFNGTNNALQVAGVDSPTGGATDFSVALVFRTGTNGAGGTGQWWQNTGLVDSEQGGAVADWGIAINGTGQVGGGLGNPDVTTYSAAGKADNAPHVVVYTRTGGTVTLNVDGVATSLANGSTAARNINRVLFGSVNGENGKWLNGDIAEVQMFASTLSADQVNALGASLAAKYAVAGTTFAAAPTASNLLPVTTAVQVAAGATLDLNGTNQTVAALTGPAGGAVALGTGTLTVNNATDSAFAGAVSGAGGVTKTGAGRLLLNGANTYAGPTAVQAGTLGGSGSIAGPVNVSSGATLAPGNSVGTLATGSLTLAAGSTYAVELDPTNSQGLGTADLTNVTGAVDLGGSNLSLTLLSAPAPGQSFTIVGNDASDAVIGTFAQGGTITAGGFTFSINYAAGTGGNDVVLTAAVPEPGSVALLGGAAAGLLLARRRRRASSRR